MSFRRRVVVSSVVYLVVYCDKGMGKAMPAQNSRDSGFPCCDVIMEHLECFDNVTATQSLP